MRTPALLIALVVATCQAPPSDVVQKGPEPAVRQEGTGEAFDYGCEASRDQFRSVDDLVGVLYDLSPFDEAQADSVYVVNAQVRERLTGLLSCAAGREVDFGSVLENLGFVQSQDGLLRAFSWYGNNGGTFHEYTTAVQYFPSEWEAGVEFLRFSSGPESFISLAGDGGAYLGLGSERTCSTCVVRYAQTFVLKGDTLAIETPIALDARMNDILDFRFDPATSTLHFAVVLDDLNQYLRDEYEVMPLAEAGFPAVDLEMLMDGADSEVVRGTLMWDGEAFRPGAGSLKDG